MATATTPQSYLEVTWIGDPPPADKIPEIEKQAFEIIRDLLEGPGHESSEEVKVEGEKTTTWKVAVTVK